jgi:hypothetical protein
MMQTTPTMQKTQSALTIQPTGAAVTTMKESNATAAGAAKFTGAASSVNANALSAAAAGIIGIIACLL